MLKKKDLKEAISKSSLKKGDILFCHSDLSILKDIDFKHSLLPPLIYKLLIKKIGVHGTLVVPTFTYSFCNKKVYDPKNFKTFCGSFSNYVKDLKESRIYKDPNVSVAIVGKYKNELSKNPTTNAYENNSFFDRFYKLGGKICNINLDVTSTFIHYFERKNSVKYRFDKTFHGQIKTKNELKKIKSIIFVRYLKQEYKQNLKRFIKKTKKFTKSVKKKKLIINVIDIKNYGEIIKNNLRLSKYFLINKK